MEDRILKRESEQRRRRKRDEIEDNFWWKRQNMSRISKIWEGVEWEWEERWGFEMESFRVETEKEKEEDKKMKKKEENRTVWSNWQQHDRVVRHGDPMLNHCLCFSRSRKLWYGAFLDSWWGTVVPYGTRCPCQFSIRALFPKKTWWHSGALGKGTYCQLFELLTFEVFLTFFSFLFFFFQMFLNSLAFRSSPLISCSSLLSFFFFFCFFHLFEIILLFSTHNANKLYKAYTISKYWRLWLLKWRGIMEETTLHISLTLHLKKTL